MELRCPSGMLFGHLDGNVLSVSCKSNRCGRSSEVVCIHRFDVTSGAYLGEMKFKRTPIPEGGTKE